MPFRIARLAYLFAVTAAMIGWSWLLLHGIAWAFDL